MCEFCNDESANIKEDKAYDESYFLWLEEKYIFVEIHKDYTGQSFYMEALVNFCPMCGRKL